MIKGFPYYKNKFGLHTNEGISLGLERIQDFLHEIGNPHYGLKAVHIAGTNGKGSTVQFLKNILMEAGLSVGTFTSPHILNVNDQISTNTGPISIETFEGIIEKVIEDAGDKKKIERLTDFELLTVLAIVYFSKISKPDIVIFETGMGGLTDSTNIIAPLLSIITNISLEHTAFLGDSIEKIAFQKAGIIKEKVPCITGVKNSEALSVIKETAKEHHSKLYVLNEDFFIDDLSSDFSVHLKSHSYTGLKIGMKGFHQKENGSLAVMAAQVLNETHFFQLKEGHIQQGLEKTSWPGRYELISTRPDIILDGAHNPDGINCLVETLKEEYPDKFIHFLFGAFKDKNCAVMIHILESIAEKITFVDFDSPRAASATHLAALSSLSYKQQSTDLLKTLSYELAHLNSDDILVITGSLYLISEIKPHLGKNLKNMSISL